MKIVIKSTVCCQEISPDDAQVTAAETTSHGITTIRNAQSVQDYFAEKIKAKTNPRTSPDMSPQIKARSTSPNEVRTSPRKKKNGANRTKRKSNSIGMK